MTNFTNIGIKESTKQRFKEVEEEYLKHHPEMKHVKLSYDILLNKIIDYYIEH